MKIYKNFILIIYFSSFDLVMAWTKTICIISPSKFGQNPVSSIGDVFYSSCGRQTTNNGNPTITKVHLEHMAQVS